VTVSVLIVVAVLALLSKGNDSGGGDSGGGGFDIGDLSWLDGVGRFFIWDLTYPRAYTPYLQPTVESQYQAYTQGKYVPPGQSADPANQGFILNCYSYLFGDGDPNDHIEERKWQLIADHIRSHNGVATAEQLACFTGANPSREYEALPVLVRFDGQPEVTDKGNIIYVFPNLQVTGADHQQIAATEPPPAYLEEKRWEFSQQPAQHFISVAVFACLNFIGCMWLLGHMQKILVLHQFRVLIDYLSIYAAFFLFFPIIRYFALQCINGKTALRNLKRKANYKVTQQAKHARKLAEAQALAVAAPSSQVVYSTDKDILEQQFES
jgi:hypothetical protein